MRILLAWRVERLDRDIAAIVRIANQSSDLVQVGLGALAAVEKLLNLPVPQYK